VFAYPESGVGISSENRPWVNRPPILATDEDTGVKVGCKGGIWWELSYQV